MPGSVANPVQLDHYQTIKEVGWGKRYIAYTTNVFAYYKSSTDTSCPPDAELLPIGATAYSPYSMRELTYLHSEVSDNWAERSSSGWTSISGPSITGLPTFPTFSFSAWAYAIGYAEFPHGGGVNPKARWDALTGDMSISAPALGPAYSSTKIAKVATKVGQFTGTPSCYNDHLGNQLKFALTDWPNSDFSATLVGSQRVAEFVIDVSGTTATYSGKTYAAAGICIVNEVAATSAIENYATTPGGVFIGRISILLAKQPTT